MWMLFLSVNKIKECATETENFKWDNYVYNTPILTMWAFVGTTHEFVDLRAFQLLLINFSLLFCRS